MAQMRLLLPAVDLRGLIDPWQADDERKDGILGENYIWSCIKYYKNCNSSSRTMA